MRFKTSVAKTFAIAAVILFAAGCSTSSPCVNLIQNGSFEETHVALSNQQAGLDSTNVSQTHWIPEIDGVLVPHDLPGGPGPRLINYLATPTVFYPAPDGTQFVFFRWVVNPTTQPSTGKIFSGAASISQPIGNPLVAGYVYRLSFYQASYRIPDPSWNVEGAVRVEIIPTTNPGVPVFANNFYVSAGSDWKKQVAEIHIANDAPDGLYTVKFSVYKNDQNIAASLDHIVLCEPTPHDGWFCCKR